VPDVVRLRVVPTHAGNRRHGHLVAADAPPKRFYPQPGRLLTVANIHGPWRPSGAVAGAGMGSVVWETSLGTFWAPVHSFTPADQLRLIEMCRRLDAEQFGVFR
jgi:hypothetical protein